MAQMILQQYIDALGGNSLSFCVKAGVPHGIMKTIAKEDPIAESYANRICTYLTKEFGRPIALADVKDIKIC
jgi:hypothetical protein